MLKILRRLIGEDIDLAWLPRTGVLQVKIDPSQIDQILANLCINARDAIAGVGKITIETDKVYLDEAYCAEHPEFSPGNYILLVVSDNGCGMHKETLARIFEPFFTTKDSSRGTGLGLATVYGIVKQNKGFVNVYSEPEKGTTFRIYLARYAGAIDEMQPETIVDIPHGHDETVLIVEDEVAIINMGKQMLAGLGYRVLAAQTPKEALKLAEEYVGKIHLLISDVVMPDMNGRDLAEKLSRLCPGMHTLFMSGYTANVIAHQGVLDKGVNFIQKPFSRKDLACKVRSVIDTFPTPK